MEIKEFARLINKYRIILVMCFVLGGLLGTTVFFIPSKFIATGSFYVERSVSDGKGIFFDYEGYYGQQTAQAFTNSVIALFESIDLRSKALKRIDIKVNEQTLRYFSKQIKVKKAGPQVITLTTKGSSEEDARKLWKSMAQTLNETLSEITKTGDPNLHVRAVSVEPVTKTEYKSLPLYVVVGSGLTVLLMLSIIFIKEQL